MQNTTITASGSTIVRGNFGATQFAGKDVELYFDVVGTVSGTSPTLSFTAEEVAPYASSSQLVGQSVTTANAIATSTHYTISLPSVTSDALEIAWTIGGSATPTFNGVYVTIVSKPHSTNIRPGGVNTYAATTAAGIATGTSAATVDICQIWHPATDLQTAEVEKIFINTSATGTVSGIETVTIYPITTEGTSCGSTPSISKADQGEPGSSVVVNTACTASTVRGTAFQSAIFPAGAVGSATNPQGVIWWDGTREFGRPLTMRAGVAEGWEVAVTYGTAPSGAQSFNCGWVWQEK